jgi:SAM-dependent methyltransferase
MTHVPVTECFTGLSDIYNRHRPGYPVEAIHAIVDPMPKPVRVADIGCGTGISTRLLAMCSDHVIGMDPNDDMLAQAGGIQATRDERIEYRRGTGERTGLPETSVNVVVCAQSFHWFEAHAALAEFHRILASQGRLALMWNVRDNNDAFTAAYGDVVHRAQADARKRGLTVRNDHHADLTVDDWFARDGRPRFANPQDFDLDGLLGRARSASYFPRTGPLRDELEGELRRLFDQYQRDGHVVLQQFTEVTLGRRIDRRKP